MTFTGIKRVFSTQNEEQYNTIGAFWDKLASQYGRENLQGLGYDWTESSIGYVIGLKKGIIPGADCTEQLPDEGWTVVQGKTEQLGSLYDEIYRDGRLTYEIESFRADGSCEIRYYR